MLLCLSHDTTASHPWQLGQEHSSAWGRPGLSFCPLTRRPCYCQQRCVMEASRRKRNIMICPVVERPERMPLWRPSSFDSFTDFILWKGILFRILNIAHGLAIPRWLSGMSDDPFLGIYTIIKCFHWDGMLYSELTIFDDWLIESRMLSSYSLIRSVIIGMPSGPWEEDSLDIDRAAQSSAVMIGLVTSGGSKPDETVATSSSSLIGEGGGGLLRTLA